MMRVLACAVVLAALVAACGESEGERGSSQPQGTELVLQACPRRRYADPLLEGRQRRLGQAAAVVAHLDPELVVLLAGADIDVARSDLL